MKVLNKREKNNLSQVMNPSKLKKIIISPLLLPSFLLLSLSLSRSTPKYISGSREGTVVSRTIQCNKQKWMEQEKKQAIYHRSDQQSLIAEAWSLISNRSWKFQIFSYTMSWCQCSTLNYVYSFKSKRNVSIKLFYDSIILGFYK